MERRSVVGRNAVRLAFSLGTGGVILGLCGGALALEAETLRDGAIREQIIVTGARASAASAGTKSDTPLMATPQTITVIDAEELARRNALSINQALGYVAGVSPNQRGGTVSRYDQLLLRGFSPGFYLDGQRLIAGPYSTPQIDFTRIERVDVVKGPASVLYGNSTPGGLVNLTSRVPQAGASGRVELQGGNYRSFRGIADINQPLTASGSVLFRAIGGAQRSDGFTAMTERERYHFSPMLTVKPGEDTSLTMILAYQRDPKDSGYSGVPAFGSVLPNPMGELPRNINTGDPDYERFDRHQRSAALQVRHRFSDALSFSSNSRFQNTELSYRQIYVAGFATTGTGAARNTDYSTIIRGGGGADEDFDTFTTDNHLAGKFATGPLRHSVLAGLDYQRITGENFQQFNAGETSNPLTSIPNFRLFQPTYGGTMPSADLTVLSSAYVNTHTKRNQTGIYLQDQISIDKLQLIASGRYDWYRQISLNKKNNVTTPLKQKAFTGRLGALYELPGGVAPFLSYSESFEPQAGTTWQGTPFDPVTGRQYEVGVKYQPTGTGALFTLSAYDLRRQKVPVADPAAGTGGIPTNSQIQIGEVVNKGIELEGRGEVAAGLDVVVTGTYLYSEITQGAPASGVTPSTTGTQSLGTPRWMASSFVTWDLGRDGTVDGPLGGLTLGIGVRYVGGSDGTTAYAITNGVTRFNRFRTKAFTLVDTLLGYELGRLSPSLDGFNLALNTINLFNRRHVSACPFSNSCYFGAARTVTGSMRYRW